MTDLTKQRRMPLADAIYERLLGELMDGQRAPGEQLNIVVLSREYDASQTPIREALARLEHTGLVERQALKGYRVAPLFTERELLKLMDVRLILEPAMAFEAGRRLTPEFLEDLRETIEGLERADQAPPEDGFRMYWKHDERFHGLIARQTDNPFLEAAYASLGGQVQRFRLSGRLKSVDGLRAATEHRAVYDAFMRGDAKAAEACMRDHIVGARQRAVDDVQQLRQADAI